MQQDGNISDVVIIIVASHDDQSALLTILNKKMHLTCVDLRTIFHCMISTQKNQSLMLSSNSSKEFYNEVTSLIWS